MTRLLDVLLRIAYGTAEEPGEPVLPLQVLEAVRGLGTSAFRSIPRFVTIRMEHDDQASAPGTSASDRTLQPTGIQSSLERIRVFDVDDEEATVLLVSARLALGAVAVLASLADRNPALATTFRGDVRTAAPDAAHRVAEAYARSALHNEAMGCLRSRHVPDAFVRAKGELGQAATALDDTAAVVAVPVPGRPPSPDAEVVVTTGDPADDRHLVARLELLWDLYREVVDAAAAEARRDAVDGVRRDAVEIVCVRLLPSLLEVLCLTPLTMDELISAEAGEPLEAGTKPWATVQNRIHRRHGRSRDRLVGVLDPMVERGDLAAHEAAAVRSWIWTLVGRRTGDPS